MKEGGPISGLLLLLYAHAELTQTFMSDLLKLVITTNPSIS